jgi:hypothetical protein
MRGGLGMPQSDNPDAASLFPQIEAVIVALHELTVTLRNMDKRTEAPDERNVYLMRLLAKHLAEESARLERVAARFAEMKGV